VPTYGYRCPQCSLEFEVWQRMSDEPIAPCPTCGASGRRLFFPAGIVFKGSGFYKTDNRKAGDGSSSGSAKVSSESTPAKESDAAKGSPTPAKPDKAPDSSS
jgi:putative FmdB family regulatory protein